MSKWLLAALLLSKVSGAEQTITQNGPKNSTTNNYGPNYSTTINNGPVYSTTNNYGRGTPPQPVAPSKVETNLRDEEAKIQKEFGYSAYCFEQEIGRDVCLLGLQKLKFALGNESTKGRDFRTIYLRKEFKKKLTL